MRATIWRPRSRGLCSHSSIVRRTTLARSTQCSSRGCVPSARASASSRSTRRVRRVSASTRTSARASSSVPLAILASSCACASAPAIGVRSSCALLYVKLRSASSASDRRPSRRLVASTAGRISVTTPSSGSRPSACGSWRDTALAVARTCWTSVARCAKDDGRGEREQHRQAAASATAATSRARRCARIADRRAGCTARSSNPSASRRATRRGWRVLPVMGPRGVRQ